jgi:uncharacterized protein with von Willebrand factor type A (vWA) domain
MQLTLRKRRPSRPELVVLCDISGSVAEFSSFTLGLTHALQDEFTAVRSWVFIDGIVEVTQLVRESGGQFDPRTLLAQRGLITGDGRSDYASALSVFLTVWRSTVHAGTTVLIIGDARMHERRAPIPELNELRHLSRRLYWLNPESTSDWDTKDSVAGRLAAHVDDMLEVSTLRMLGDAVSSLS